jgi:thioredoxin 1
VTAQQQTDSHATNKIKYRIRSFSVIIIGLALILGGCGRGASRSVVAEVNGQRITVKDVKDELARTPQDMRVIYEQNPEEILDQLISVTLILQEAQRKGAMKRATLRDLDKPQVKEEIRRFLDQEIKEVRVTDQEVTLFYRQHRDKMSGKSLPQVREAIRQMLHVAKREQEVTAFVERLRASATITAYPERLPKPPPLPLASASAEEFKAALQNNHPTVADFGSSSCVPCIQLRPVLRGLKDTHGDRINVLVMEVSDNRDLARQYKVRLVPTLIFFDAKGKEVHRSVGYMDREEIEKVLRDLKFLGT